MADSQETAQDQTAETSDADDRAAFLAEMRGDGADGAAEKDEPKGESGDGAESDDDASDEVEETAADEDDDQDSDEDETEESGDEDDETEDDAPDADKDKRLAAVQKAERRSKEQLARERKEMHAEIDARVAKLESDWKPRIEAAQKFESLRARAKYDPVGVLTELGLTEDDFELAGQTIYAHSKAAGLKPETRAAAQKAARERELADELVATKKRQDALEKQLADRDQAAAAERAARVYLGQLEKAVSDKTPLAKHFLAKNREKYQMKLAALTEQMWAETGTKPEPVAVLKRFERVQREELEEIGVDPTAFIKAAPGKRTTTVNGKTVTVETKKNGANGKSAAKPKEPEEPLSDAEEREAFLAEMRAQREAAEKKRARA